MSSTLKRRLEQPLGTAPATPEQQAAIEKLRQQVRAEREKAHQQPPVASAFISALAYVRGIEKRHAFKQSDRPSPALLEFARLKDSDAERFRAKYPDYFPTEFWEQRLPSDDELYQGSVFIGERPTQPSRFYWQGYRDVLRAAWACAFDNIYVIQLLNIASRHEDDEDYIKTAAPKVIVRDRQFHAVLPFQADILAVVRCGWPVRLCEWCGEPILALRPNIRFCPGRGPKSCYVEHRRDTKKRTWHRRKHVYRGRKAKGRSMEPEPKG